MPKSRTRKRGSGGKKQIGGGGNTGRQQATRSSASAVNTGNTNSIVAAQRSPFAASANNPRSLLWPALVALGCWGMAVSFLFFSNDPNHILFGVLVVVMALLWTLSLAVRWRKMMALRQK